MAGRAEIKDRKSARGAAVERAEDATGPAEIGLQLWIYNGRQASRWNSGARRRRAARRG